MTNLLGISGSLRSGSANTALLRAAAALAPPGVRLQLWSGLAEVPPFNEDHEADPPAGIRLLREAIAAADGLLIATPEYNFSIPGQLKNALDWASRPHRAGVLTGRPVAVVGASAGASGAARAQAELRTTLAAAGAAVLERELSLPHAGRAFDDRGRLRDTALTDRLAELLRALVATAEPDSAKQAA